MLRNILGPIFNFNLDQFLTLELCYFLVFFCFGGGGGGAEPPPPPIFIVFSANMQNLKKHKKGKKTLFVNTTVLTALVKMSVFQHFTSRKTKTKEHLESKSKQNKNKSKTQKLTSETGRKEEEKDKRQAKKENVKKGEA